MKFKKLFAALAAGVMAVTSIATSASAGHIIVEQQTSRNYKIDIVAAFGAASHDYTNSETLSVSHWTGNVITLKDVSGRTQSVTLGNVYLNDALLTQSTVKFGYMTTDNTLPATKIDNFTWRATATITGIPATTDPATVIDLTTAEFVNPLTITFPDGIAAPVSKSNFKFTSTSDAATSSIAMPLTRYSFNNGYGLSIAEQNALMKANSNLTVTVTFSEAVRQTTFYSLYTDINMSAPVSAIVSPNQQSVTFSVSPKIFYDPVYARLFSALYIVEAANFNATSTKIKSVDITYPDGNTTTTNTNTNTSNPNSTVSNDEGAAINEDEDEDISINYSALTLNVGEKFQLETSVPVTWKTSSKSTVTVYTNGKIKPKKAGTATITGTTANGNTVTCRVTAINSSNPTTAFDLTTAKGTVRIGKKYTLKYTCDPASETTDKITWTSSDPSIAAVSSTGKITPKAVGKVTITATTSSGLSDSCTLTVKTQS